MSDFSLLTKKTNKKKAKIPTISISCSGSDCLVPLSLHKRNNSIECQSK